MKEAQVLTQYEKRVLLRQTKSSIKLGKIVTNAKMKDSIA